MANAIETTISINDNMSKVLQNVMKSVNMLISSMESLNRSSANALDTRSLEGARQSIAQAQNALRGVDDALGDARDSQDKLNDEIGKGTDAADRLKGAFSGVGSTVKTAAKAAAGIAAAGAAAVGAVVTKSVEGFADYEQLKGGVETLFGAGGQSLEEYAASAGKSTAAVESQYNTLLASQQTVLSNADKAFSTAGLSANAYMETVTSFSASLLQSLGGDTAKAADYANRAIIDMSDNANKMGTDMQSIQNAYQGFAKQNYTMLDNLKLGYGGTKEEMARLIEDAAKMKDIQKELNVTVDAGSMSFGNIVNAISVMQESMDIAGTTGEEAATTISGSLNSMKAAWDNTLVAIVRGGDNFDSCIDNLVNTATTFAGNVLPAIEGALNGVGALVEGLAPMIGSALPTLITDIIPSLAQSTGRLVSSFAQAITDNSGTILTTLTGLASMIAAWIPTAMNALPGILVSLLNNAASAAAEALPGIIDSLMAGIAASVGNAPAIFDAGMNMLVTLAQGLVNALPTLISYLPTILEGFVNGLTSNVQTLYDCALQLTSSLVIGLINALPALIEAAPKLTGALISGLVKTVPKLAECAKTLVKTIWDTFTKTDWLGLGKDIITGLINGIKGMIGSVGNAVKDAASSIWNGFTSFFDIGSPSKLMYSGGVFIMQGLRNGLKSMMGKVGGTVREISKTVNSGLSGTAIMRGDFGGTRSGMTSEDFRAMRESVVNNSTTYTVMRPIINVNVKNDNNIYNDADMSSFTRQLANDIARQIGLELEGVY